MEKKQKSQLRGKSIDGLWKVNTVALLREIGENSPSVGIMRQPINIFGRILEQVAGRALELNDPKMNRLMCRLALYEQSDPYSKDYDQKMMDIVFSEDYIS